MLYLEETIIQFLMDVWWTTNCFMLWFGSSSNWSISHKKKVVLIELLQLHQKGDLFDPQKILVISPKISQRKGSCGSLSCWIPVCLWSFALHFKKGLLLYSPCTCTYYIYPSWKLTFHLQIDGWKMIDVLLKQSPFPRGQFSIFWWVPSLKLR